MVKIIQYWDRGVGSMPPMIRLIYEHNLEMSKRYNFELLLLDKKNLKRYIRPPLYFRRLTPALQSDVVRFLFLHDYGGIWLDSDAIILKDMGVLFEQFEQSEHDMVFNCAQTVREYPPDFDMTKVIKKLECAFIMAKSHTVCTESALEYLLKRYLLRGTLWGLFPKEEFLKSLVKMERRFHKSAFFTSILFHKVRKTKDDLMHRLDLGPYLAAYLYRKHPDRVLLNRWEKIKDGSNFVFWKDTWKKDGDKWLLENSEKALERAKTVFGNTSYVLSWTIYRLMPRAPGEPPVEELVFNDKRSVFHHLIELSKKAAG